LRLQAREVAETVLGKLPKPRYADYLPFKDADGILRISGFKPVKLPKPCWVNCLSRATPIIFRLKTPTA
ncbi:hypothetical protein C2U36_27395, partial [Escherichia coli]